MQLTRVSFETKQKLIELGFDWPTTNGITQEIARKWVRDIYNIDICATTGINGWFWSIDDVNNPLNTIVEEVEGEEEDESFYESYEIALEYGLRKFCELIISLSNISQN